MHVGLGGARREGQVRDLPGEGTAELLAGQHALQRPLSARGEVGPVDVEEDDVQRLRVSWCRPQDNPSDRVAGPGLEARHGQRGDLEVAHVDGAGGQGGDDRPLERPGCSRAVPGGHDGSTLAQRGGVGGGQAHDVLRGQLDVDQARHPARSEQRRGPPALPDHAGVDDRPGLDGLVRVDLDAVGEEGLLLDQALVADDRALLDPGGPHDVGVLADHAATQAHLRPDEHVAVHHGPLHDRPAHDHDVVAEHRQRLDAGARLDLGVRPDHQRALQDRVGVDLGTLADPHAGSDLEAVDLDVHPAAQHVDVGPAVGVQAADVLPVALRDVAVQRGAGGQQCREDVAGPVDRPAALDVAEDLRLHHVDPGVDRVAQHLAPGGFLQEALDPAVAVLHDNPEVDRVAHPGQAGRHQRSGRLVGQHELAQVDVGERVARDDQEGGVTQRVLGVRDRAGRPERRLLGRVAQVHAQLLAVPEVGPDQAGEELNGHDGLVEAVAPQQAQHVLHHWSVGHRQQGLGLVGGHRPQPGALAAGHHDGPHEVVRILRTTGPCPDQAGSGRVSRRTCTR